MENPDNEWINPGPRVVSVFNVWDADIRPPRWVEDSIGMEIRGAGFPEGLRLELDQKKAHNRMDRVRISFLRLAGQHPEGRGYRLKRVMDHWKRPVEPETWKF